MDTSQMETTARRLQERAGARFKDASTRLRSAGDHVVHFVKEHPGAALAGAFALGYVIARGARR